METLMHEYRSINRTGWPSGAWDAEPDKVQWVDAASNLDCLIVRNDGGAWCGYVGVPESHPWFGVDYSGCTHTPKCEESWCDHRPEGATNVHGGLTFADSCSEPTRERWEQWRASMATRAKEAIQYPKGDASRAFRDTAHLMNDFEAWKAYGESRFICHIPGDGRPSNVWWFGFDCAHSGDFSPAYDALLSHRIRDDVYRDRAYVSDQVTRLAAQLRAVGDRGAIGAAS